MIEISWEQLASTCVSAITAAGADLETATALSDAVVSAERRGNTPLGVAHLFDYLDALRGGRLNGTAQPVIGHTRGSVVTAFADDGVAQRAFRAALPDVVRAARANGVAVLSI